MGTLANMKQSFRPYQPWDFVDASKGNFTSNTLQIPNGQNNLQLDNATGSTVTILNCAFSPVGRKITLLNPTSNTVTFTDTAFGSLSASGQMVLNGGNAAIGQGGTIQLQLVNDGTYFYWTEISRNVGG